MLARYSGHIFSKGFLLVILTWSALLFNSCNPTRKLGKDEKLLVANIIKTNNNAIDKDEVSSYIKQKPNRRVFAFQPVSNGYPFYLGIYNMVNIKKMKATKEKRDKRYDAINKRRVEKNEKKNQRREAKGKKRKNVRLKSKDKLTFREWLVNIGEVPVVYDSTLTERSSHQISLYLNNKGYFNNTVTDSVVSSGKKVEVYYLINTVEPYRIREITYQVDDPGLVPFIYGDTVNSLLAAGQVYDVDILQAERDRITRMLKNQGYYYFFKEYIFFRVDSALNTRQMNITLGVKKQVYQYAEDSVAETRHQRYKVNDIYINPEFIQKLKEQPRGDTTKIDRDQSGDYDYYIISQGKVKYKPQVFFSAIFLRKGEYYKDSDFEATYKRLAELRAFRYINIDLKPSVEDPEYLDVFISLTPVDRQSFSLQGEGTNTGGVYGVAGSIVYQNRNSFKRAEILEIKMKGGMEIQKQVKAAEETDKILPFNTLEFGPELNLYFPRRLFPYNLFKGNSTQNPRTTFTSSYNFQSRPDYVRTLANISYSFTYKESDFNRFIFYVPEISVVKSELQPEFREYINSNNDIILRNRFTDHFTSAIRLTHIFNNQDLKKKKNVLFIRTNLEESGLALYPIAKKSDNWTKDSRGSYQIAGINFSHYLRFDTDFRYYRRLRGEHNQVVWRIAGGIGHSLSNVPELPFEKSFYAGGPNSVRAWEARTLGPGSYSNPEGNKYQLGDIHIESNLEYRFKIFKMLNSALFVDVGNVWIEKSDPNRPGGQFLLGSFLDELAIGAGLGFRVDFSFFIIRLDAAIPVKDPAFPVNDRWQFNHKPFERTNLNFGIGYPF